MKRKNMKRVMAAVIAAAMVLSSALVVNVAGTTEVAAAESSTSAPTVSGNNSSSTGGGTPSVSGNDTSAPSVSGNDSSYGPSSGGEYKAPTYEEKMYQSTDAAISVAGSEVRTSIEGVYAASSVRGTAVKTSMADVRAALGLTEGQKPVIIIYDIDARKSTNAMECITAGANSIGGELVASLYIDLGAKERGKWITVPEDGSVALVAGLPKGADTSATYSVVSVQPGGVVTILEDLDTNPNTVTFTVNAGIGAYGIVAR